MANLTPHFTVAEFGNPPAEFLPRAEALAAVLELVRAAVNEPVIVTSGYRSPEHNARVGGSKTSDHMTMEAVDIRVGRMPSHLLRTFVEEAFRRSGFVWDQIIWYKKSRHVHIGTGGSRRQIFCGD